MRIPCRSLEWLICLGLGLWAGSFLSSENERALNSSSISRRPEGDRGSSLLSRTSATPKASGSALLKDLYAEAMPERSLVDAFLEAHRRNAHALMAAGLACRDDDLLREAVRLSPDDPQLQLIAIGKRLFPEDQGLWIRRFKESQPDNALSSQLLAAQLFDEGDADGALAELRLSLSREDYNDFAAESILAREEVWSYAGASPVESAMRSTMDGALYRPLSIGLQKFTEDLLETKPSKDAVGLALAVAQRITKAGAHGFPIDKMVGLQAESVILNGLDPDQPSPYGELSVVEARGQVESDLKEFVRKLLASEAPLASMSLDDPRLAQYLDRTKLLGFEKAQAWLTAQLDSDP